MVRRPYIYCIGKNTFFFITSAILQIFCRTGPLFQALQSLTSGLYQRHEETKIPYLLYDKIKYKLQQGVAGA